MSMTAKEIREITDSIVLKTFNDTIERIDNLIQEKAAIGEESANSGTMAVKLRDKIISYYEDLGFETNVLGNQNLIISW